MRVSAGVTWLFGLGLLTLSCAASDRPRQVAERAFGVLEGWLRAPARPEPGAPIAASLPQVPTARLETAREPARVEPTGVEPVAAHEPAPVDRGAPEPSQRPAIDEGEPSEAPSAARDAEEAAFDDIEPVVATDPAAVERAPLRAYARPSSDVDPDRALVSTAKVTNIYLRPSFESRKLGYLRAGAIVQRQPEPATRKGCSQGFYEIAPEGYVCVGDTASLDIAHDLARAVTRRADRTRPLPYPYGKVPLAGAPLYTRVPTKKEQRLVEKDLHWHLDHRPAPGFEASQFEPLPWFLQNGAPGISAHGYRHSERELYKRMAIPNSGFAFLSLFEAEGRQWGLTVDMLILPLDRLRPIEPSQFHGIPLVGEARLPVVFSRSHNAFLYDGHPKTVGLKIARPLEYREAIPITGEVFRIGGRRYYETRSGQFVLDQRLVRVDPMKVVPSWATPGRSWIDVSILEQSLVAYEGTTPVFATLVSTGIDGIGDPETTHSTIQGQFLIHTKHVTATMSSDEVGDEFDLRDVPYVQYFTAGFALHASYWHDAYGTPRSHGCVNLSPLDARWLFGWTDPPVPSEWHGAMSLRDGTLVSIHP